YTAAGPALGGLTSGNYYYVIASADGLSVRLANVATPGTPLSLSQTASATDLHMLTPAQRFTVKTSGDAYLDVKARRRAAAAAPPAPAGGGFPGQDRRGQPRRQRRPQAVGQHHRDDGHRHDVPRWHRGQGGRHSRRVQRPRGTRRAALYVFQHAAAG